MVVTRFFRCGSLLVVVVVVDVGGWVMNWIFWAVSSGC